jgi:hypothetical protein
MAMLSVTRKGGESVKILAEAVSEVINIDSIQVPQVNLPETTGEGDNVGTFAGTTTFISEDLSKQVSGDNIIFTTSANYSSGSISVYLNGLYMTRGIDYEESSPNKIIFIGNHADSPQGSFVEDLTIISAKYAAES